MSLDLTKPLFITGVVSSSFLSGCIASISLLTVPTFLASPSNISRLDHWRALYDRGLFYTRPIALVGAAAYFATAFTHHHPSLPGRTYKLVAAGLLTIGIVPFTLTAMSGVNRELQGRDDRAHDVEGDRGDEDAAESVAQGSPIDIKRAADVGIHGRNPSAIGATAGTPVAGGNVGSSAKGKRKRSKTVVEMETTDLLRKWQRLNIIRAMLPLIGTIVAFEAL